MTFPILETERLILRQVKAVDAGSLLTYLSDPDVMKHVGLLPFESIEDALGEISWYDSIYKEKTGIRWGITLKDEGEVIGSCGFLKMASQHFRAEIGTELSKEYWGQGIASEALEAVIQYGFNSLDLQRIEGLIEPANLSSQKLFEKHGFLREGLLRKYEFTCGKFDDLYLYSLLKEEFPRL
ncbi:GNAT family N-acetyltransferase [Sutcliffiella halmapala]|uniref:GNAT family N-acetyltransferase n=1 Tax=Sutcliffiella halmapala TaxID=79882 RepID=UPI0011171293|nr:GNAT family protein [Sutcliffiella halmapala]